MKRIISLVLVTVMLLSMLPTTVFAESSTSASETVPEITIDGGYGEPGGSVDVYVELTGNPGITSANLSLSFDSNLTLVSAASGAAFSDLTFTPPSQLETNGYVSSACQFVWFAADIADENIKDGTILVLTFDIAEEAEIGKSYKISISSDIGDVVDKNLNQLSLGAESALLVIDYTPGDVNGDGKITMLDVVWLSRYIVDGCQYDPEGYAIQLNENAANVNDDGKINMLDVVLLCRYIVDGCQYDPDGYGVKLVPISPKCTHTMEAISYKAATCLEEGNISYYHCTTCDKYYNDSNGTTEIALANTVLAATGHTAVTDPYVAPTYTSVGWTEGSHCSVCSEVLVAQEEIPMLELNSYSISYSFTDSDPYLQGLVDAGTLVNDNPTTYTEQDRITLINLSVPGYVFEGWYDGQGSNATQIKTISNQTGNMQLYAHWSKVTYTVTFDSPDIPVDSVSYTVDTGITLKNPSWFGYTFVGWSKDGKIVSNIPVGTTGNITLHANWTSNRNRASAVSSYGDPIIVEDWNNGRYLFVYEIGTIENVPLGVIEYIGNSQGISINKEYTYTQTVSESFADTIAKTVSNATTKTSAWTLSEEWNDSSSATNEHEEELGKTNSQTDSQGNVTEGKYYISNSEGGVTSTTSSAGGSSSTSSKVTTGVSAGINGSYTSSSEDAASVSVDVSHKDTHTETSSSNWNASGTVSYTPSSKTGGVGASGTVGGGHEWGDEDTSEDSTNVGVEVSTKDSQSATIAGSRSANLGTESGSSSESHWDTSSTSSSSWNATTSYEASQSTSVNIEVSNTISEAINDRYSYTSTTSRGGGTAATQSTGESQELSDEYASTVEYLAEEQASISKSITYSSDATGYYRLVTAGTVHVFAVVGYDIATNSYYTYTYSVLDEERHEYLDYSKDNANFNDCENAILPFEVPYAVNEFITTVIAKSDGLVVDMDTGYITEYNGSATDVVVPQYVSVNNGDGTFSAVRIRGIEEDAFKGNSNITGVVLPKYVSEIPNNAFAGCTSLETVIAYGISKIGDNAFAGCTSLKAFMVDKYISELGNNAFENVPEITVYAENEIVADAAINSGANSITLNLSNFTGTYSDKVIEIADSTEYFALIGNGSVYKNIQVDSHAGETFISNMNFVSNTNTPLKIASDTVTLSRVTVENAPGFALIMTADNVALNLYGTIAMSSAGDNAVISKNITLAKANAEVAGKLNLTGNYLVCGDVTNTSMLTFTSGEIVYLAEEEYESMLTSSVLTFDPNGGEVETTEKLIYYGQPYGELPTPARTGYGFTGWYTEANGGTQVTPDTVVTVLANQTLYAHWDAMAYNVSWNAGTGYTIAVNRTSSPYANASIGALSNGEVIYYGDVLSVTYTASTGYTISSKGSTSITVTGNVTSSDIYCTAAVNQYTATWSDGTGYTITVKRTSSPLKGASTGALSNGEVVYYGDVLSVTYTASTGYTISSKGSTSITVTGNVTSSDIYATATVNSYTVSWNAGTNCTITVKRTSSPLEGAEIKTLSSGETVYYGDVLSITYTANTGYSISTKGSASVTVTGNVTSSIIYATAAANSYTYNIVYKSSNGTALGTSTATYKYGTTNTISAPAKSGYNTPSAQSVVWDSTSAKTITFTYTPTSVSTSQSLASGTWTSWASSSGKSYGITYAATVEYQNRTASSVQIRIKWTNTLTANSYYGYAQYFSGSCGGVSTGTITICSSSTWSSQSSSVRTQTVYSGWITVPVSTTNQTSLTVSGSWSDQNNKSGSWSGTVTIPAY